MAKRAWSEEQKAALLADIKKGGMTIAQLAEKHGRTPRSVAQMKSIVLGRTPSNGEGSRYQQEVATAKSMARLITYKGMEDFVAKTGIRPQY